MKKYLHIFCLQSAVLQLYAITSNHNALKISCSLKEMDLK